MDKNPEWQDSCSQRIRAGFCTEDRKWACRKNVEGWAKELFWKHRLDPTPQDHYDIWYGSCAGFFTFYEKDYIKEEHRKPTPRELEKIPYEKLKPIIENGEVKCSVCKGEVDHIQHFNRNIYYCNKCHIKHYAEIDEREIRRQNVIASDVRDNIKKTCLQDGVSFNHDLEKEDSQSGWKEFEEG